MQPKSTSENSLSADYRQRIYEYYASARPNPHAPATTDGFASRSRYLEWLITRFFPSSRDAHILDLGCGQGALLHYAGKSGYRNLEGVDRSPQQVAAAQRLSISAVRQGDLLTTLKESADASKDVIVTFDVIEHFKREELLPLVDEIHRALKPEGKWIIHVPNGASPLFGRIRYGDLTHELAFTHVSISQLLLASGFAQVQCFEDKPLGRNPIINLCRRMIWAVIRGLLLLYIAAETGTLDRRGVFSQNLLAVATKAN